jgi:acetyl-CoA C-acetyltransferase
VNGISEADAWRVPVIIGAGQVEDRPADPFEGLDSLGLMRAALEAADADAGGGWLAQAGSLAVVDQMSFAEIEGIEHRLAETLGLTPAHVERTYDPSGDGPIRLLNEAANRVASGEVRVAAVVGGEALRTAAKRREAKLAEQGGAADDGGIMRRRAQSRTPPLYLKYGLLTPTDIYPLYENALRASLGQSLAEAQAETALIWSNSSKVAAENPHAWLRRPHAPQEILEVTPGNRPINFPYSKLMVANNAVNMGAGLLVTSLGLARERGVPEERLVYVGAGVAAHEPDDRLERDRFDRTAGMTVSMTRALQLNGLAADDLDYVELYSCFPCMPKMGRRVIGWPAEKPTTVYGGLTFGGGPIGNCMMHAAVAMTVKLRQGGTHGLIWANGGFPTHNHSIVLSRRPSKPGLFPQDFDHQAEADALRGPVPRLLDSYEGPATVESYSVPYGRDGRPTAACIVARTPAGDRFLARVDGDDADLLAFLTSGTAEPVGSAGTAVAREDGYVVWRRG